jgi:septal ring factor EnvC (AmiA/AmiB activator)
MDILTTEHERSHLEAHVDLCAMRYKQLDDRLQKLESDVSEIKQDIIEGNKSLKSTVITTAGTIIVAILGVIATLLIKF